MLRLDPRAEDAFVQCIELAGGATNVGILRRTNRQSVMYITLGNRLIHMMSMGAGFPFRNTVR